MSFASENKILVSQSFFEVVSRLSDDYKRLFQLKGVEKDKHVREHTVYHLVLPGSEKQQDSAESAGRQTTPLLESASRQASPAPEGAASTQDYAQERPVPQGRSIPWLVGGAALVVLAAAGVWLFYGPIAPATNVNPSPIGQDQVGQGQTSAPNAAATATAIEPTSPAVSTPARPEPAAPSNAPVPAPELAPEPLAVATPPAATPQITNVVVSDGMPFTIALAADVRSDADIGRPLRFTAVQDIRVRGVMVIPKGAAVTGQISETAKKKFLGIGAGKLSFELLKAETAGGQQLGIRALSVRRDDGATQRPLETNTHTGSKDIAAAQGARYIAYVDGEQTVAVPQK